jgi:hypothetical protein
MIDNIRKDEQASLEKLMNEADLFAKHSMQQTGGIPPVLFIHGENGIGMFRPDKMGDQRSKDHFAGLAQLVCIATGADATVFVSEGWVKMAKAGERLDLSKAPSEYADRQEMAIMMGQTRTSCQQRMLPMIRSKEGKFLGFGNEHKINADRVEGRFANLIPWDYPSVKAQAAAKEALSKLGVASYQREEERRHREDKGKYHVISPDGLPLTPVAFASKKDAEEFIPKWCERFKAQGYYAAVGERIPLDELVDRLAIVPEAEYIRAVEQAAKQRHQERGRGMDR